jgi:cell division protein FtsQ
VPRLPRAALWGFAIVALLAAAGLWLRDSPLVAVKRVTVTGLSGPEASRVESLLEDAARDMTTLHVRTGQLRAVVAPYPVIKDVKVATDFPHALRITVIENTPIAAVQANGATTPVGADGRLLRGAAPRLLPIVPLRVAPGGASVADPSALRAIAVLAAAPPVLRARVERASTTRSGGLTLTLRDGPELHFGGADRLAAKWAAAAAVLADPNAAGATYIDVRYPERPAAGGLEDPSTQLDPEASDAATNPSTATPATVTPTATGGTT